MTVIGVLCVLSFLAWAGVLIDRRGFWKCDQRLDNSKSLPGPAPSVVAVIPARNEARDIGKAVSSLLAQNYDGPFHIVVVDDNSTDGTANAALAECNAFPGKKGCVHILRGQPLPGGWAGKLWAVDQGIREAKKLVPDVSDILMMDADIEMMPGTLARLVSKSERDKLVLVSLMVKLRCHSFWERLLIPPFIFFFQKLYPFGQVNNPKHARAGAAGGCMLIRRTALDDIGGIESIRGALIDDCTLGARLKTRGPVFLGLANRTRSLRPYDNLGEIWSMVTRSAYVQLNRSPLMLAGSVLGMILLYLVFPFSAIAGILGHSWGVAFMGIAGWLGLAFIYTPTLRLFDRPALEGLLLPASALLYTLMTLDSARRHYQGRGGEWKGRSYQGNGNVSASATTSSTD